MEMTTDEMSERVKNINKEVGVIEGRILNMRGHVNNTEKEMEDMKHLLFKGFHQVNEKINHLETSLHTLIEKIDKLTTALDEKK